MTWFDWITITITITTTITISFSIVVLLAILATVWGVYRFRTRDERRRRRRRDPVRRLCEVFDAADARGELTPQRRIEIADGLRRLHRG